jgi:hypothetical protein
VTQEEAQRERDRLAEEDPASTWLVTEADGGEWQVVRVGLKPTSNSRSETVETRPRPPHPDDARTAVRRNVGGGYS